MNRLILLLACWLAFFTMGQAQNPGCNALFQGTQIANNQMVFQPVSNSGLINPVWFWDFGDGNTGFGATATHTYAQPGGYVVCLTLVDSLSGCVATSCDSIWVQGTPTSSCDAQFSWFPDSTGGNSVIFLNQSTNGPGYLYFWDFGDGNTASTQHPFHTYAQPGTYTVCLAIYDTVGGCSDTTCEIVSVSGSNTFCHAAFSYLCDSSGTGITFFNASSFGAGATYFWDFGDGNTSTAANPNHTYAAPGMYTVCLVGTDTSGCVDSTCMPVFVVPPATGCAADFSWSGTATGLTYAFTNLSTSSNPGSTLYTWDFGDGNTSNHANPTHTYNSPGPWIVCLTVLDSANGCVALTCNQVGNSGALSIAGFVVADSMPVFEGTVYLIEHDSVAGTLTAIDSLPLITGDFLFSGITPGTYLVKAALSPSSPSYANYLPTYMGDELFWYDATSTIVTNNSIQTVFIDMVAGNNPGGPGFVGGLISQGANKQGDPMENISLLLLDELDQPVTHIASDENGEWEIDNLAYGTYHLYVEVAGRYADPFVFTLSADNPTLSGIDFEINSTNVVATDIEQVASIQNFQVYPNPASTSATLAFQLDQATEVTVTLMDMAGRSLKTLDLGNQIGEVQTSIELEDLSRGMYLLRVQMGAESDVIRLTVE